VRALRITVLSTMLADVGIGEWGYAALVEADGRRILFDTGAHPRTVLANAREMKIDLGQVETVVLSHNHSDHTGGLLTLRRELKEASPGAVGVAHVGAGMFTPRLTEQGENRNYMIARRGEYEQLGGRWVEHAGPAELAPGVWLTGPVPRPNDERNWQPGLHLADAQGRPGAEDNVPEDSSLVFDTPKGLVILTGCGHAGIVNICEDARRIVRPAPIECLVGGLHLYSASNDRIAWTAGKLKAMGVRNLLAGHCTGIEATYQLRAALGLTRASAVVSAVGSSFSLDKGLQPGELAA
jgi:7,8-dihydropterin-6-yl-methyl-4-(beta-D-ribofuranosyl)aminobenzene 5'-phosphate synthase